LEQGSTDTHLQVLLETFVASTRPQDSGSEQSLAWLRAVRCLGTVSQQQLTEILNELAEQEKSSCADPGRLDELNRVCFWALADEMASSDSFRRAGEHCALACLFLSNTGETDADGTARRVLALLRWYQHTGDSKWLHRAQIVRDKAALQQSDRTSPFARLVLLEMEKPERAELFLPGRVSL
jgi:hypothetical protein